MLWISAAIVATLLLGGLLVFLQRDSVDPPQIAFSELLQGVARGAVKEIVVAGDAIELRTTDGQVARTLAPPNYVTANPSFIPDLAGKGVRIDIRNTAESPAYGYGALLIGLVRNGLNLMQVDSNFQKVAIGAIIYLAVMIDMLQKKRRRV